MFPVRPALRIRTIANVAVALAAWLALAGCDRSNSSEATVAPVSAQPPGSGTPAANFAVEAPAQTEPDAWPAPDAIERDGPDADLVVRIGDLDNFGFGFPDGFDPYTGQSTPPHPFPFEPTPGDARGTDRIMVVSGWRQAAGDGYTATTRRPESLPQSLRVSFDAGGLDITGAALQLFVDDFQAPVWQSRYRATVNGREVALLATTLNALDQTGPIGKLLTVQLLPEHLPLLHDGRLEVSIDDPGHDVADGFAFDFARLLVNPKPWRYSGTIRGVARDKATGEPLAGVLVSASNTSQSTTAQDGRFVLERVPAGLAVVSGSHPDYLPDTEATDLVSGDDVEVTLELEPAGNTRDSIAAQLDQQGHVDLYGIYFDTDQATLKAESGPVLEQVRALLEQRPRLRLVVAGHTDAEGSDAHNQSLSDARARAVVAWLVDKGVDGARLSSEGHGETRPVANNGTAEGRALNRRVEIRDAGP